MPDYNSERAEQIDAYLLAKGAGAIAYDRFPLEIGGRLEEHPVYALPTDLLAYNLKNGRFAIDLMVIQDSLGRELNADSSDDANEIEQLLLSLNAAQTENLQADMKNRGQIYPGVISWDGYVINGNRRMAILRRLNTETPTGEFETIKVFRLAEGTEPKEIWRLEAGAQLSAEMRQEYSPINELLKYREGVEHNLSAEQIAATLYGRTTGEVTKALARLELIERYLDYLGKSGQYIEVRNAHERFIEVQNNLDPAKRQLDADQLECFTRAQFDMVRADNVDNKDLRELRLKVLKVPAALERFFVLHCPSVLSSTDSGDLDTSAIIESEEAVETDVEGDDHESADPAPDDVRERWENVVDTARAHLKVKEPLKLLNKALRTLESLDNEELEVSEGDRDRFLKALLETVAKAQNLHDRLAS